MTISPYAIPGVKAIYRPNIKEKFITPELVESVVCKYFNTTEDLRSRSRRRELVLCRHIICFILRKHTKKSLKQIGQLYGRDHTTAIHSIQSCRNWMETDESFCGDVDNIERLIFELAMT